VSNGRQKARTQIKTLRILIVEDDAIVAMILGELLAGMGHEICATAATAGPVPHFFLSGDVGRIKAMRPNAIVVQKPFRLLDLTRAMEAALDRARVAVTA
jgi:hypothetical protein